MGETCDLGGDTTRNPVQSRGQWVEILGGLPEAIVGPRNKQKPGGPNDFIIIVFESCYDDQNITSCFRSPLLGQRSEAISPLSVSLVAPDMGGARKVFPTNIHTYSLRQVAIVIRKV